MKKILVVLILLLGCNVFAFEDIETQDITTITGIERIQYLKIIKQIAFAKDYQEKLKTPEFKKIIKEHKKDKNSDENYYAAQAGYSEFKNNNISAMFTPKMDIMYMYTIQEKSNLRIKYYYSALGNLKYIDFMYGNYPNYPYFVRQYTKYGNIFNTTYYQDNKTQIKFNKQGTSAEIIYKGIIIDNIKLEG